MSDKYVGIHYILILELYIFYNLSSNLWRIAQKSGGIKQGRRKHTINETRDSTQKRGEVPRWLCATGLEKKKKKIGAEVSVHQREVGRRVVVTTNKLADMLNRLGKAS